ncbi:hypothetical protein PGT21_033188 [Puccinia graminis f. sp. tritici]|uniref:Uncharacterized protein n=1 Tax=Puccinia graminis f. sp. tritici TaxID=56615 RepID=A0A5B0QCJ6_PUCGR|nr:hypothetical protein PGT21_033188 [Puccinia graminis f. sp. tritici]
MRPTSQVQSTPPQVTQTWSTATRPRKRNRIALIGSGWHGQGQKRRSLLPQSNSHPSRSTSPVLDHPTAQLRPKPSNSKLLASPASNTTNPTADEALASVGKRNRIFSSKGQFIPAAPQSTTGLSLPSAQQDGRSNHSESKLLVPLVDDRGLGFCPKGRVIRPAPMIDDPRIKDSSPPVWDRLGNRSPPSYSSARTPNWLFLDPSS